MSDLARNAARLVARRTYSRRRLIGRTAQAIFGLGVTLVLGQSTSGVAEAICGCAYLGYCQTGHCTQDGQCTGGCSPSNSCPPALNGTGGYSQCWNDDCGHTCCDCSCPEGLCTCRSQGIRPPP
jgi:hypothetical protein